jgi:hypothetical protein
MRRKHFLDKRFAIVTRITFIVTLASIVLLVSNLYAGSPARGQIKPPRGRRRTIHEEIADPDVRMPLPLPIDLGTAPAADVSSAISFLRLPVWSHGYRNCTSDLSEVSCLEVVRAAEVLRSWEGLVLGSRTIGDVYVDVKGIPLADKFSMLYHGLQIAASTSRNLYADRAQFAPFELPESVKQMSTKPQGERLDSSYRFTCSDFSARFPNLVLAGASYPQVLYTHKTVAPWLRLHFSFHAAYFMGNYLFGTDARPPKDCVSVRAIDGIEGFEFSRTLALNSLNPPHLPIQTTKALRYADW